MKYFISYVIAESGHVHDHRRYGNATIATAGPITAADIENFKEEHLKPTQLSRNETLTVIFFGEVK